MKLFRNPGIFMVMTEPEKDYCHQPTLVPVQAALEFMENILLGASGFNKQPGVLYKNPLPEQYPPREWLTRLREYGVMQRKKIDEALGTYYKIIEEDTDETSFEIRFRHKEDGYRLRIEWAGSWTVNRRVSMEMGYHCAESDNEPENGYATIIISTGTGERSGFIEGCLPNGLLVIPKDDWEWVDEFLFPLDGERVFIPELDENR